MGNKVCHTVRENALTMNCSHIFKSKRQYIVHLFFLFFSLTIKDKTKISLTIKILLLGQGSFTRKVRTIFTLKIIVSFFVKLFLILVLHLQQFFFVRIFVKRATEVLLIFKVICQRSRSPGKFFRRGDTPRFAFPMFYLHFFLKIQFSQYKLR